MSLFSDICAALLALPGAAGCHPGNLPHLRKLQGAVGLASDSPHVERHTYPAEGATRRAILDLLESISCERPLLICVDDADQLDDASRDLLDSLPERGHSLPLLFLLAGNHLARLPNRRDRTTRLGPLTREHSSMLARLIWDRVPNGATDIALDWCVDSAAGNPGHLDLLVRHAASLRDTPVVPPDLIALLDSRIESLSPAAKHALQACVIFGADCGPTTVAALTGLGGYELLVSLESLVDAGVVIDVEQGISCRSSLLADRVLSSTTPVIRKLLHQRAARFLEGLRDAHWTSQATAWRIADHWLAANDRAEALKWRRACWQHLLSIGQPMAAAESVRSYLPNAGCDTERAALLDDLAHALEYAADIEGQLWALQERIALSDRIGDGVATRIRLAADVTEARRMSYDDITPLLPELQALLNSTDLDRMRRLRAAKALMIAADSLLDEGLAKTVYDSIPRQPLSAAESLLKYQVELIFHSVFGDRDIAVRLANSLSLLAEKKELSTASVSALLTAQLALRIVDGNTSDTSSLERLFDRCMSASMYQAAIRTSARIGNIKLEDGAIEAARCWSERTAALVAQTGAQRLSADFLTLQIDLALLRGDLFSAQQLIDSARHHFPLYASPRWSKAHLTYRLRVAQYRNSSPGPHHEVELLIEWHDRAKRLGRHDDEMQVLWTALWRADRRTEASTLLREYLLNARRERRPISFMLLTLTAEDPIWSELAQGDADPAGNAKSTAHPWRRGFSEFASFEAPSERRASRAESQDA